MGAPSLATTFLLLLVASFASRAWAFGKPLAYDAGEYLYIGSRFIHGATPYRDVVHSKGPVVVLLYGAIDVLAGHSETFVRLTLCIFVAMSALALAGYVGGQADRRTGLLAGLLFAVLGATTVFQGDDPNTEQYGLVLIVGALWLANGKSSAAWTGAGALTAAAILMNLGFAFVLPFVAAELWLSLPTNRRRAILLAIAGGVGVTALIVFWLALAGALGDMWTEMVGFASTGGLNDYANHEPATLTNVPWPGVWLLAAAGACLAISKPRLRHLAVVALAWLAVTWLRPMLAGYQQPHHFYLAMPGIAIGLTLGIATLRNASTGALRVLRLAFLLPIIPVVHQQADLYSVPAVNRWGHDPTWSLIRPISTFVRNNTDSTETIRVAGNPVVYWLSQRRATTRFVTSGYTNLKRPAWPQEFRHEILAHPPAAIVRLPGATLEPALSGVLSDESYRLAFHSHGGKVWLRGPTR